MGMEILKTYLNEYGVPFSLRQEEQFCLFAELLEERNKVMNLTTVKSGTETEIRHFLDSLSPLLYLSCFKDCLHNSDNYPVRIADLGTGAGFPGIPLAIMSPECNFVLIDSLHKRIDFINEAADKLELCNVSAICGRFEELGRLDEYRDAFDIVMSRAVADLRVLTELALPFVKVGGLFVSYKGDECNNEVAASANAISELKGNISEVFCYNEPVSNKERYLVVLEKLCPCPDRYPRRNGVPSKRPL